MFDGFESGEDVAGASLSLASIFESEAFHKFAIAKGSFFIVIGRGAFFAEDEVFTKGLGSSLIELGLDMSVPCDEERLDEEPLDAAVCCNALFKEALVMLSLAVLGKLSFFRKADDDE